LGKSKSKRQKGCSPDGDGFLGGKVVGEAKKKKREAIKEKKVTQQ